MTKNQPSEREVKIGAEQINVRDLLTIDETNLSNEYARQASLYGWVVVLVAEAELEASLAKQSRELSYAEAYEYWRKELEKIHGKVTEAMVSAAVTADGDYIAAKTFESKKESEHRLLRGIADALKMRADMLISLGAHLRAEQDMTNMRVNTNIDDAIKTLKREQASLVR